MPRTLIVSSRNAAFQRIDALKRNRTKRQQAGSFFVEGVRAIEGALEHGWAIEAFVFERNRRLSGWARALLDGSRAEVHYALEPALMAELSDKEDTSEVLALVRMPPDDLARIPAGDDMLVLLLDRPASPGNLGTVVRTADAFGARGVVVAGHAADVYDPQTIRASVGSLFAIPTVRAGSNDEIVTWIGSVRDRVPGLRVVGSSARDGTLARDAALTGPLVLVLGNEARGMSAGMRALCDEVVTIPLRGTPSSLNVASATAVLLYEADRQRGG